MERDLAYLQRRILQEQKAAAAALTERARNSHIELAGWYERMLTGDSERPQPAESNAGL